ncbi:MAG: hypothetical protein WCD31_01750 [Gillisia sp.]
MAIVGKIINEGPGLVNVRPGEVLTDIVTDRLAVEKMYPKKVE